MSITPMDDGTYSMRIRHEGELESLYSQLNACMVQEGENVMQGRCWEKRSSSYLKYEKKAALLIRRR